VTSGRERGLKFCPASEAQAPQLEE